MSQERAFGQPRQLLRQALLSGDVLDLDVSGYGSDNEISGEAIRELLLDSTVKPNPQGLWIRGARVTGTLNLAAAAIPYPVRITHSHFDNRPSFNGAHLAHLDLTGSTVPGISLVSLKVTGDIDLVALISSDAILARNIQVTGALRLTRAAVSGAAIVRSIEAVSHWGPGVTLDLEGANIAGVLQMAYIHVQGGTKLYRTKTGELHLVSAVLSNPGFMALNMNLSNVFGNVDMSFMHSRGRVESHNAKFNGNFILRDGQFENDSQDALVFNGAEVAGRALFENLSIRGGLRAYNSRFGSLVLSDAVIKNPAGEALNLMRTTVGGHALLDRMVAIGSANFHGAQIFGVLSFVNAIIERQNATALNLGSAEVGINLLMDGVQIVGRTDAHSLRVKEALRLDYADLNSHQGISLNLSFAQVGGNAILDHTQVSGQLVASGTRFGGGLYLSHATIASRAVDTINLEGASMVSLHIVNTVLISGALNLNRTSIGHLDVGIPGGSLRLPPLSAALGWKLSTIGTPLLSNRRAAAAWLRTIPTARKGNRSFPAEPWKELARVYESMGQREDARFLRRMAARLTTRATRGWSRVGRSLYGAFVGYGYRPGLVVPWIVVLWVSAFGLASSYPDDFRPTNPSAVAVTIPDSSGGSHTVPVTGASENLPEGYPKFSPELIALDTSIPPIASGQSTAWRVTENQVLAGTLGVFKTLGWALAALFLASLTGIIRKD